MSDYLTLVIRVRRLGITLVYQIRRSTLKRWWSHLTIFLVSAFIGFLLGFMWCLGLLVGIEDATCRLEALNAEADVAYHRRIDAERERFVERWQVY